MKSNVLLLSFLFAALNAIQGATTEPAGPGGFVLDGSNWLIAIDPANQGASQGWQKTPPAQVRKTKVPWIIQDAFPDYHGVAWYWREFSLPAQPNGRILLRFWAVDYKADVWLNGVQLGKHEGGESPFELDAMAAVHPGSTNRLAVRVVNPTTRPIDGLLLAQVPHRNKALPYSAGSAWNQGGIMDTVELRLVPDLRLDDVFARADWQSGSVRIDATVVEAGLRAELAQVEVSVGPARGEGPVSSKLIEHKFAPGTNSIVVSMRVHGHQLWNLNDPALYRATVRVRAIDAQDFDERSVRFGFRDFRFADGYFKLNGRRIYLRSSHTGNCSPIGLELPHDPDLLRRDLLNVKVMGFNCIRFIAGVAKRYQLDLCDEIGLLVYEEAYASWCLADSPQMASRYDESILGMVRRDRNHPCVVMWGLLNETPDGPVFRHAIAALPRVRELDDTRLVMLNSGAWHDSGQGALAGLHLWRRPDGPDPNVAHNPLTVPLVAPWATWEPGRLTLHPGPKNEYSALRWTAPASGVADVTAHFFGPANQPTTDVHLLHKGASLFDGWLNLRHCGNRTSHTERIEVSKGDTIEFVVGPGNGNYGGDTTGLEARISSAGSSWDPAAQFPAARAAADAWNCGWLAPGATPKSETFQPYPTFESNQSKAIGVLSNPGSPSWEDVLSDQHPYQQVPHTAEIIHRLRTFSGGRNPVFISEYGVGSAVDLWRATRHYERLRATHAMDAKFYRDKLNKFLADWERWRMSEVFGRPEDFFAESNRRMAGQRLLGINAIRSNPGCVGYSLTGTVDQGMTGEGLFTTFRELKPGTVDAVFEGLAPLRWCLFVEPAHIYNGQSARCEAVLANEDQLAPGNYAAQVQVFGPQNQLVWEKTVPVRIPEPGTGAPLPFAIPVLNEVVKIDAPAGPCRLCATLHSGAAPTGGESRFFVSEQTAEPRVTSEIALCGEDPVLTSWFKDRGIRSRPWSPDDPKRGVILAGTRRPGQGDIFDAIKKQVESGSRAIFLMPEIFAEGNDSGRWLPLATKGRLQRLNSWLYHKDEWARPHPAFEGLPTGLMDYTFYRNLVPDRGWLLTDAPTVVLAGANDASQDYSSAILLCAQKVGAGQIILNTLRLRENLGRDPAADRLLANVLRWAELQTGKSPRSNSGL